MSQLMDKARLQVIAYRMAIMWFFLFSINSLCSCIVAASAGSVWTNLDAQAKVTVIIAVIGNWTGTIMAFLSDARKKIEQEIEDKPQDTK
jgi:NADH:ubiquinone oxidoreductase subunit 6 (subunit J)